LLAVAAAAYLSFLGTSGLKKLAIECMMKARSLAERLNRIRGFHAPIFSGTYFSEFTVRVPIAEEELRLALLRKGIDVLPIGRRFPELGNCLLVAVTEITQDVDIENLVHALQNSGGIL
jgi:glycine dehydrogenase subunit 1